MSRAISVICTVPMAYAAQVPLPAKAKTRGMVRTGERTGAMTPTDWASVSQGVRMLRRRPYSVSDGCKDSCGLGGSKLLQKTGSKMTGFTSDVDGDGEA